MRRLADAVILNDGTRDELNASLTSLMAFLRRELRCP
jgi:hypothetical protein